MEERTFEAAGLTFTVRTKSEYQSYLDSNGWRFDVIQAVYQHLSTTQDAAPSHVTNIAFDFSNLLPVTVIQGKSPLAGLDIVGDVDAVPKAWDAFSTLIREPGVITTWLDAYNEVNHVATDDAEKKRRAEQRRRLTEVVQDSTDYSSEDMGYWMAKMRQLETRETELVNLLTDADYVAQYPHSPASWQMYQEYRANNVLPVHGGYMDQPAWFWDDVWYFRHVEELENDIPRERRYIQERINRLRNGN